MGPLRFFVAVVVSILFAALELLFILCDRRSGRLFHALARSWARSVLHICGVTVRVRGLEKVRFDRNYVYVSNHASMLDIPVIVAGIPDQIRIVYKKELHVIPVFGWGLKLGAYIAIDRGRGTKAMNSLEQAIGKIRNGASVLLYAEGTRTTDGKLQQFKRGAFTIAARAGVPVVPLTVNGSYSLLRKRSFSIHPGVVEIVLDAPIPVPGGDERQAELALMKEVHSVISRHYITQE